MKKSECFLNKIYDVSITFKPHNNRVRQSKLAYFCSLFKKGPCSYRLILSRKEWGKPSVGGELRSMPTNQIAVDIVSPHYLLSLWIVFAYISRNKLGMWLDFHVHFLLGCRFRKIMRATPAPIYALAFLRFELQFGYWLGFIITLSHFLFAFPQSKQLICVAFLSSRHLKWK